MKLFRRNRNRIRFQHLRRRVETVFSRFEKLGRTGIRTDIALAGNYMHKYELYWIAIATIIDHLCAGFEE